MRNEHLKAQEEALAKLGERFTYLRKKKGLSQVEVSKRLNVSQSSIGQIETGKTKEPAFSILFGAAEIFDSSVEWILFGDTSIANFPEDTIQVSIKYNKLHDELKDVIKKIIENLPAVSE